MCKKCGKLSEEHKRKISESNLRASKLGKHSYWLGKKRSIETVSKLSGKNNYQWKGDNASYSAKHYRICKQLGKPTKCEKCGITGLTGHQIHWANLSGEYKQESSDWVRLCVHCHKIFDINNSEKCKHKLAMRDSKGRFLSY